MVLISSSPVPLVLAHQSALVARTLNVAPVGLNWTGQWGYFFSILSLGNSNSYPTVALLLEMNSDRNLTRTQLG